LDEPLRKFRKKKKKKKRERKKKKEIERERKLLFFCFIQWFFFSTMANQHVVGVAEKKTTQTESNFSKKETKRPEKGKHEGSATQQHTKYNEQYQPVYL
jgi:hypothetical protein